MNIRNDDDQDNLRSFLLMSELENDEPISQREIAGKLGIALGLVNSYLKSLAQKGFVSIKSYPSNRYAYLLTPQGFAEKSRIAFQHMSNFNNLYRITRQESLALFTNLKEQGVTAVVFCGIDDLTEISYLSLQQSGLELEAVMESVEIKQDFLGRAVIGLWEGVQASKGPIIITALQRAEELKQELLQIGVTEERICGPALNYEEILSRNITEKAIQG